MFGHFSTLWKKGLTQSSQILHVYLKKKLVPIFLLLLCNTSKPAKHLLGENQQENTRKS